VTSFGVATTRKWTNANGELQEKTTWFQVTCWRKLAELTAQYLQKGRLVLVEGDVEASAWTDREGAARASLKLTATNVQFLGGRGEVSPGVPGVPGEPGDEAPVTEDDIPF